MKTVSFYFADHLLVGQLCTNPKSDRSFYHVWKCHNVQRARSEIYRCTTHAPYRSKWWQQDHCWIATNNRDVPGVMKTKLPATVMVFGVVPSEGHIMPPHIFEVGVKVNIKVYVDVLKSVVIPWCNQVAGGRPWVWQQDSVPVHKSKEDPSLASEGVLQLCTLPSLPTSFPDLNPLDYFVWSYVEDITNMTSNNTKASLITTIRRVFAELPPALVEKAWSHNWDLTIRCSLLL